MSEPPAVRIEEPAELLAAVPYLLGYHPTDSIVVMGLRHQQVAVTCRTALPDLPQEHDAYQVTNHDLVDRLTRLHIDTALIIGYGEHDPVRKAAAATGSILQAARIPVPVTVRVHGNRWWDLTRADTHRCPPEGTAFDVTTTVTAATATAAGLVAHPSRADIAAQLAPGSVADRGVFAAATTMARTYLRAATAGADTAICHARGEDRDIQLWTGVLRQAPEDLVAGPATMLAFTAMLAGNGVLARAAVDRALHADPDHEMARLAWRLMQYGVDPATLADVLHH